MLVDINLSQSSCIFIIHYIVISFRNIVQNAFCVLLCWLECNTCSGAALLVLYLLYLNVLCDIEISCIWHIILWQKQVIWCFLQSVWRLSLDKVCQTVWSYLPLHQNISSKHQFRGVYFAVVLRSDDGRVLANNGGGIPMVTVEESFAAAEFASNFNWIQKVRNG